MPRITSSELVVNREVIGTDLDSTLVIAVDPNRPLPLGRYVFQLQVFDRDGNPSNTVEAIVNIVDRSGPIARVSAPESVPFNTEFILDASDSEDVGGGTIGRYVWTLVR